MVSTAKQIVKALLFRRLGIPFNPHGVPNTLALHLDGRRDLSVLDVGAYDGCFTKAIEGYCGVSRGILVEPLPGKAAALRDRFQLPRFSVYECVLSSAPGTAYFEVNESLTVGQATSSLLKIRQDLPALKNIGLTESRSILRPVKTLDEIADESRIAHLDLLKIDVQGAEHPVLLGGSAMLQRVSMIWTEFSFRPIYEGSSVFADVYALLTGQGFKLLEIEPGYRASDGELLQGDALFARR